jgi:ABC-type multidrug transport system ATPase subunit
MGRAIVELEQVSKRYRSHCVLTIPALAFLEGERVAIAGRNGSGKSTLLRVITKISLLDGGTVRWGSSLAGARLGYVPQSGGLYRELPLQENLRMRRRLFALPPRSPRECWYICELGLEDLLDRPVSELSGGYQRLAALAAALHGEPTWLVLDEPFSGVDEEKLAVLRRRLLQDSDRPALTLIAGPALSEMECLDRAIVLEAGKPTC